VGSAEHFEGEWGVERIRGGMNETYIYTSQNPVTGKNLNFHALVQVQLRE